MKKSKYGNVAGKRLIGGREHHYGSRGEANLARVLEMQRTCGMISEWQREFTFDLNVPGNGTKYRTNIIDFRVVTVEGKTVYYEYKGLLDTKAYMRLQVTKQFFPDAEIVLVMASKPSRKRPTERGRVLKLAGMGIEVRWAKEMFKGYRDIIPDWE